jgi:hypothetical protein
MKSPLQDTLQGAFLQAVERVILSAAKDLLFRRQLPSLRVTLSSPLTQHSIPDVLDGQDRMPHQHPWTGVAHNFAEAPKYLRYKTV